jgi:site-specific DNA recombinase
VVVHRLDRLCRSVRDICDILPTFTLKQISLVSIAQAFDSESPMGRLTLHLLTSFGQFERELAGERTADKVAITRASGKWQRNGIPLGYVLNEKQALQVDPAEAAVVRDIFERVAEGGSVAALLEALQLRGYRTKLHVSAKGNRHGGEPFNRNTLNQLLRNRMYVGEVFYRDAWHPAAHEPIIDQVLWDRVQAIRAQRTRSSGIPHEDRRLEDFPLNQRLFWQDGRAYKMHVSTTPKGRRHCYYVGPQTAEEKSSGTGPHGHWPPQKSTGSWSPICASASKTPSPGWTNSHQTGPLEQSSNLPMSGRTYWPWIQAGTYLSPPQWQALFTNWCTK